MMLNYNAAVVADDELVLASEIYRQQKDLLILGPGNTPLYLHKRLLLRQAEPSDPEYGTYGGSKPVLDGGGIVDSITDISNAGGGSTFKGLVFKGDSQSSLYGPLYVRYNQTDANIICIDCDVIGTHKVVYATSRTTIPHSFTRCTFTGGNTSENRALNLGGSHFYYCKFYDIPSPPTGSHGMSFYNCTIDNIRSGGGILYLGDSGTEPNEYDSYIVNTIVSRVNQRDMNGLPDGFSHNIVQSIRYDSTGDGELYIQGSVIEPRAQWPGTCGANTAWSEAADVIIDAATTKLKAARYVKNNNYPIFATIGTDDSGSIPYFVYNMMPVLAVVGVHGYASEQGIYASTDASYLQRIVAAGHEIASHGMVFAQHVEDHSGIRIAYSGAGTGSFEINSSGGDYATSMVLALDGSTVSTIDFNVDSDHLLGEMSLDELVFAINAVTGFSAVNVELTNAGGGLAKYLPDTDETTLTSTLIDNQLNMQSSRVWMGELRDSKMLIEKVTGQPCTSFVSPGVGVDDAMEVALLDSGYSINRCGDTWSRSTWDWLNVMNMNTIALAAGVYLPAAVVVSGELVGSSGQQMYSGTLQHGDWVLPFSTTGINPVTFTDGRQVIVCGNAGTESYSSDGIATVNYMTGEYTITFDSTTTGPVTVRYSYADYDTVIDDFVEYKLTPYRHLGGILNFYAHNGQCSMRGWQRLIQKLQAEGVRIVTLREAAAFAANFDPHNNMTITDGGRFQNRVMLDSTPSYELASDAIARGLGSTVSGLHDQADIAYGMNGIFEHFLDDGVDSGAYPVNDQRKTITATTYAPTGYDVRGTADSPAKITLEGDMTNIDTTGLTADETIMFLLWGSIAKGGILALKSSHKVFEMEGCVPRIGAIEFDRYNAEAPWTNVLGDIHQVQVEDDILYLVDKEDQFVAVCLLDDPGMIEGEDVDWWVVLVTPGGEIWSFVWPMGWVQGLSTVFIGPLTQFDPIGIYWTDAYNAYQSVEPMWGFFDKNYSKQPGTWFFAFGIDDEPNGKLDGKIWYDTVSVIVPE